MRYTEEGGRKARVARRASGFRMNEGESRGRKVRRASYRAALGEKANDPRARRKV